MTEVKFKDGILQLGLYNQRLIAIRWKHPSEATIAEVIQYLSTLT